MTAYVLTTEHKDIKSTSLRTTIFKIFEFLLYPSIRKKQLQKTEHQKGHSCMQYC